MGSPYPLLILAFVAAALIGLGLWLDDWWPLAGGIVAAAAGAWLATEPPDRRGVDKTLP